MNEKAAAAEIDHLERAIVLERDDEHRAWLKTLLDNFREFLKK